jgi:hypothetical protein
MPDLHPLTKGQRELAAELDWYRAWLLSTGREAWQVDPVDPAPPERYVGYRCRRREHPWCRGRWGGNTCSCPCHQEEP